MMAAEGDLYSTATRKRKTISSSDSDDDGEVKSIYLLFGSRYCPKAAGLYEFKIRINRKVSQDNDSIENKGTDIKSIELVDGLSLIQTFFDQTIDGDGPDCNYVFCVGGAPLPSNLGSFLIVPNEFCKFDFNYIYQDGEFNISRIPSLIYNVFTKNTLKLSQFPNERKASPFVACLKNKVYVLSCISPLKDYLLDPTFEVFDPETNQCNVLKTPPFNRFPAIWLPLGYAVYKDYIIVSLCPMCPKISNSFCYYHTPTDEWKKVVIEGDLNFIPLWSGEAQVINGVVFGYDIRRKLFAFPFSEKANGIVILNRPSEVSGWLPYVWEGLEDFLNPIVAIGKIGDRLLCNISTVLPLPKHNDVQQVRISFHYIDDDFTCHFLHSFDCSLPCDDNFNLATSCLVLKSSGDDEDDNELGRGKRAELYKDYDGGQASDVEMI